VGNLSGSGDDSSLASDFCDPLQGEVHPGLHYTTTNVGEAMPGVLTPLSWSLWGPVADHAMREGAYAIGVFSQSERAAGAPNIVDIFSGRVAMLVEFLALMGDRLPGSTGAEVVQGIFGRVPDGLEFHPTRRRYPVVGWRLPASFIRTPVMLRAMNQEQDRWWKQSVKTVSELDLAGATRLFAEAQQHFRRAAVVQGIATFGGIQPVHTALSRLLTRYADIEGVGDLSILLAPSGGAEMLVVRDIWRASRGQIGVADVVREHGFHGPREGELASVVWREDDAPLQKMISQYRERDDSFDPDATERRRAAERHDAERRLLSVSPSHQRPAVRALLATSRRRLSLRGVAKRAFVQGVDGSRLAARRAGTLLAEQGKLQCPDDVFFLTTSELTGELPPNPHDVIRRRRERWNHYREFSVPSEWTGSPTLSPRTDTQKPRPTAATATTVTGVGVSPGIAVGTIRVLTDPDFAEVEPGEILVTTTTDPSWCSIMFISSALVVDIGGALSHAAVVAREMGIPCVVNTRTGTQQLHTGDLVRVDGTQGTVEILQPQTDNNTTEVDHGRQD
jgi:phosphohistidine swiveling domain-containing protein